MGVVMRALRKIGRRCGKAGLAVPARRFVGAVILALGILAGCTVDRSDPLPVMAQPAAGGDLRSRPCEVVTRTMVSAAFAVDAALIEQSSMSSLCAYRWEGDDELLDVTVHVSAVAADAGQARALFENATAVNSRQPIAAAAAGPFEDVGGLGDQARVDTGNSDLHIRSDRLYFTLNAYSGPAMAVATSSAEGVSAIDARAQWWQTTLPQRRQAAQTLGLVWMGSASDS